MVDLIILILLVVHELLQLLAEQVNLTKVQWAEVRKKGLIDEIVVDAKVKGVLARLGWVLIANPVKTTRDDLNWLVRFVSAGATVTARFGLRLDHVEVGDLMFYRKFAGAVDRFYSV